MWLLIDDERNIPCDVIARDAHAAYMLLRTGWFNAVIFDHDLGKGETGYDVLTWAIDNSYLPNLVQLVTSNPVGRDNMRRALEANGYTAETNGLIFRK